MSKIASGIDVVTNTNVTLGPNTGFQVSGSTIAGAVRTSAGDQIILNGTDVLVTDKVDCYITQATSSNATTHVLVYKY